MKLKSMDYILSFWRLKAASRDGNKSFLDSIDTGEMLRW